MRTRVGYAGGTTANPTYRSIGDHTEAVEVDFDPAVIGYEQLLALFWEHHEPCESAWSRQYQAILFYRDEAQRRFALASAELVRQRVGRPITTRVEPFVKFFVAEDYHQKYALRRETRLVDELRAFYPTEAEFRDAPATAKLNAYCYNDLDLAALRAAITPLGLIAEGDAELQHVRAR